MEFNPNNPIVKRCLQGMALEDAGKAPDAAQVFLQALNEARNDFEKFIAAFYVARHQHDLAGRLKWLETTLRYALNINDVSVQGAFATLYSKIAACYKELGDPANAAKNSELANSFKHILFDKGPFYHGTRADLKIGDLLTPGRNSNYKAHLLMNHIYFTGISNSAGLAAALARGQGKERVYIVEPTGTFENDPNVTDKKFPGNPTRSYRTAGPLKIVGELSDWVRQTPEQIQVWRQKLADSEGEIIN